MVLKQVKKITVRLDCDLVDGLEAFADQERVSVSQVVRHLVLRFLRPAPPGPELQTTEGKGGGGGRRLPAASTVEKENEKFRQEVIALFDGFLSQGHDLREATKRTNFTLKERKHPWATYEVIADIIRKTGRFRRAKGG